MRHDVFGEVCPLLPRCNQETLLRGIRFPTTCESFTAVLRGIILDSLLEGGTEMSNETLNRPSKSFSQSWIATYEVSN